MNASKPDRSRGPTLPGMIARALDGDSAAFEWIFRSYAGRLRSFAMSRGASDPDAIANDAMLRVFQNLATFSGDEAAFVRWIFTMTRNLLIDAHRYEARRPVATDSDIPERATRSAEDAVVDRLATEQIVQRLSTLTVAQREVIALRLIDDLSLADVAEIVDRPVTAGTSLQQRGLLALQKQVLAEPMS